MVYPRGIATKRFFGVAGCSFENQPITPAPNIRFREPADHSSAEHPRTGVVEHHFTVGYAGKLAGGNSWTLATVYAPETLKGGNLLDPAQLIEISMDQFEIEFSYALGN